MLRNVFIYLLFLAVTATVVSGDSNLTDKRFIALKSILEKKKDNKPYIGIGTIVDKNGNLIVLDIRRQDIYEEQIERPVRQDDIIYFTKIDSKGNFSIKNKNAYYFKAIHWSNLSQRLFNYPSRVTTVFKNGDILVVSAEPFPTGGNSYLLLFDKKGNFIKSEKYQDMSQITPTPQLLSDSKNNVYVIGQGKWPTEPWSLAQVYPVSEKKMTRFPEWPNSNGLSTDFTATALSYDNSDHIFVCARTANIMHYNNYELGYFIVDFAGKIIATQKRIKLPEDAYYKISNCALPGLVRIGQPSKYANVNIDRELMEGGMDIIRLANNELILSVTALDENDSTCIYQFKFDSKGELVKPGKTTDRKVISMSNKSFPAITKSGIVERYFFNNYILTKESKEQVFWGFDKKEQFYWESIPIN